MSKEAIELVKDIRHGIDYEFHGKCRCELLEKCDQALALLRAAQTGEPEAGEFTRPWRQKLENAVALFKMGRSADDWFQSIVAGFRKACCIIDSKNAAIKNAIELMDEEPAKEVLKQALKGE